MQRRLLQRGFYKEASVSLLVFSASFSGTDGEDLVLPSALFQYLIGLLYLELYSIDAATQKE